jgi:TatD DNase family protein
MPLHDAHNHLQDAWLAPHLDPIDAWARGVGLASAVVNGTCEDDWAIVLSLAQRFPWVRPSLGLHPWDAGNRTAGWLDTLRDLLGRHPGAAVGEVGVDRWILDSARADDPRLAGLRRAPFEEQVDVFRAQMALAVDLDRPVTIHCLRAWGALEDLLKTLPLPKRGFLLHAYSGSLEQARSFARLGAYFSFNPAFLHPRHTARREVFRQLPEDRLLVETDAPAMAPPTGWMRHPLPPTAEGSEVNHPGNLEAGYEGLAQVRSLSPESLAAAVSRNHARLFDP